MTLSAGQTLGVFEILGAIGAGGMGEVYKARDTRLDRTVAIKVMPSHLSEVLVDTQSATGFATDSSVTDWFGAS